MDGQGGNQPRRRAGDSNTPGTPSPIRDWQRNTWYGPAPQDNNPFEEPDEAPELLELRSENVKQKSGEFWQEQKQTTGYVSATRTSRRVRSGPRRRNRKKKKDGRLSRVLGRAVLITLALAAVTVGILYFAVYRVRVIQVEGNSGSGIFFAPKDIIDLSGIKINDSILELDEKKIGETLQSGAVSRGKQNQIFYSLQFRHLDVTMPGTVKITVKVREPCCWVDLRGIIYVLDKERMVLWETESKEGAPTDLVQVKGLKDKNVSRGGQILAIDSAEQERIFSDLFLEMKVLSCMNMIQEIDLSNPGSVTMTTRKTADPEGNEYVVSLGDCRTTDRADPNTDRILIHAKLRSFLLVWNRLHTLSEAEREAVEIRIGHRINGGTINVRTPESPYYSPDLPQ